MPGLRPRCRSAPMGRLILLAAPMLLTGFLDACEGDKTVAPRPSLANTANGPNGKNATVRVSPASDTLNALQATVQLTANVPVIWSSLTPSVAVVDTTGRVVAVGPGLGFIQALASRKADTARVLVRQIAASVQVAPDSVTLGIQQTVTLTAAAADSNGYPIANTLFAWASDATAVATVADGVVTGVDSGTTTIRATTGNATGTAWANVIPATPYP